MMTNVSAADAKNKRPSPKEKKQKKNTTIFCFEGSNELISDEARNMKRGNNAKRSPWSQGFPIKRLPRRYDNRNTLDVLYWLGEGLRNLEVNWDVSINGTRGNYPRRRCPGAAKCVCLGSILSPGLIY